MSEQQYCLKWNNFSNNLSEVFHNMLASESMVDVTIACEGASLKAHKMILAASSPFFQSLFMSNPCKHPIVILKDVRFVDLKATIDFIYKGEVNVTQSQLGSVLKAAETLKIKGLTEVVQRKQDSRTREVSVSSPNKKKKRPKSKNSAPVLDSDEDSLDETEQVVTVEASIRSRVNELGLIDEVPIESSIATQPIIATTSIEQAVVVADHTALIEDHALRPISYEDANQHPDLPVVTVAAEDNPIPQFVIQPGETFAAAKRRSFGFKRTTAFARTLRYPDETFYESGGYLYCKACGEIVNHMKVSVLKMHIKSGKHQSNKKRVADAAASENAT